MATTPPRFASRDLMRMPPLYPLALAGLAVLTLVLALLPLTRAFAEVQVNYNEGWNLLWQQRAAQGLTLYSGHRETLLCNYPPLSFWLIGGLGALGLELNLAARLVSLLALTIISVACVRIVRALGGSHPDGALAAAAFALPLLVFYDGYVGANDPQLLGLAFAAVALALHCGASLRPGRSAAVALLLVAAVFTKHNLIALPAAITFDTLWRGDTRTRVRFMAVGATASALLLGVILAVEGPAFFEALLSPREWWGERAGDYIAEMLDRHWPVFAVAVWGLIKATPHVRRLLGGYLVLSIALAAYFSGGAGTAENLWFDLLLAAALLAGLAMASMREPRQPQLLAPAAALIACLPALMGAPRAGLYGLEALGGGLSRSERAFAADAEFLRSRPGPALCESMLLCLRGGKVPSIDPFNTYQATRTGQLPADTLIAQISAHRFATIQIRSPRGAEGDRFRNFGLDAHDTIARDYRPVRKSLMGTFSVPAD